MLAPALAAILLCLSSQVDGLITTTAKCLSTGYDWMFSSIGQSPCDVAAELASVCAPNEFFNLVPLPYGSMYIGPDKQNANSCRCSSVYYSLLSACAHCQGREYLGWSEYSYNCSDPSVARHRQQIPTGVKVPAYAYQNVSISGKFDVALAQSTKGAESSSSSGAGSDSHSNNMPAVIGGVVGGIVSLGIVAALIAYFVFRSKRQQKRQQNDSSYLQQSSNRPSIPSTVAPLTPSTMSPPSKLYNPDDPSTYPTADSIVYDPYRQRSWVVDQT